MPTCEKTRRHFTEAAREAAAAARRRKRDHKAQFPEEHQLVMVVARAGDLPRGFVWQVRRYGHVLPVAQSARVFDDPAEAERAGLAVLDEMRDAFVAA